MTPIAIVVVVLIIVFVLPPILRARRAKRLSARITPTPSVAAALPTSVQEQVAQAVQQAMAGVQAGLSRGSLGSGGLAVPGDLGVAEVISVSSAATGVPVATVELDAIGAPKRRATLEPPQGRTVERGERLYVLVDAARPDTVTAAPASLTGGQSPPEGANRLDALVLGPQILKSGAVGRGVVKSAESTPLANPALAQRGFSKWTLQIEVTPERGWPFTAELVTSLSTPEKATRIAHAGAEVPIRFDPEDTKTVAIDSIALGYGDPYAQVQASAAQPTVTVTTTVLGAGDAVAEIKALRAAVPGLSLKAAKGLVDGARAAGVDPQTLVAQARTATGAASPFNKLR